MKPKIFSGVQPSGDLTLGNYLGALRNWAKLQDDYDPTYSIVDLHAITLRQDPVLLRHRTLQNLAMFIAAGVDPAKNTFFIQSHVKEHAELSWILNCYAYMGELSRMTQYKDKSQKHGDSIPAGLFTYPLLMAADILLYQADLVPVGDDQSQHVELTRDLAIRFNNLYGETFAIPKAYVNPFGARIYDLQNPTRQMSKSAENTQGILFLLDEPEVLRKKISRSVTDSVGIVQYSDEQPGVKNLINIIALLENKTIGDVLTTLEGKGYKALKDAAADAVISTLVPLQKTIYELLDDKAQLETIYRDGAEKARAVAAQTLNDVKQKIGLVL